MIKIDLSKGSSELGDIVQKLEELNTHRWNHIRIDENAGRAACGNCGLEVVFKPGPQNSRLFNQWLSVGDYCKPKTCEEFKESQKVL